jgi:hypothetical protein
VKAFIGFAATSDFANRQHNLAYNYVGLVEAQEETTLQIRAISVVTK